MDETPNLRLPYIMAAQSQKHVTHNEAIRALDAVVQLSVLDRDLSTPPGSPADGARYIVAGSPTGAWSGHAGNIAAYQDGAWTFYAPRQGWISWIGDEDAAVVWDGAAWVALTTGGGGGGGSGSFTTLGINATADTTNRLSLAADATLLNHDGDGHQLKINKASASNTASLLYQDAFSGRAELGLAGDDDFHFKVSADGATWKEAILINRSTGAVTLPFTTLGGGGRDVLAANRTYYVRANGSDSNNGLANTSGGAFLTIQKAIDVVAALDLSIYDVDIRVADGTYTAAATVEAPWVGSGAVTLTGNTTTPANCIITVAAGWLTVKNGAVLNVGGFDVSCSAGNPITATDFGTINIMGKMRYGASSLTFFAARFGNITITSGSDYTIYGNQVIVWCVQEIARLSHGAVTVTMSGTPAWAAMAARAQNFGQVGLGGCTFSGAATGQRYDVSALGLIDTNGGGASFIPDWLYGWELLSFRDDRAWQLRRQIHGDDSGAFATDATFGSAIVGGVGVGALRGGVRSRTGRRSGIRRYRRRAPRRAKQWESTRCPRMRTSDGQRRR